MSDQRNDIPDAAEWEATSLMSNSADRRQPVRWSEKSWTERRKTKYCGVPLGWIVVIGAILLFIIAVVCGVVGGFRHGQQEAALQAAAAASSLS